MLDGAGAAVWPDAEDTRAAQARKSPVVNARMARCRNFLSSGMTAGGGDFRPTDEIDELRWVPLREADLLLTYPHDRDLLREAMAQG